MKSLLHYGLSVLTLTTIAAMGAITPARAAVFEQREVENDRFLVMAVPRGTDAHYLVVLEQVSNQRACWQERADANQTIDPLLLNFDFTGLCGRSTDGNGYSIRMGGQDLALQYTLRIVHRNNQAVLLGAPLDRRLPEIEIGRTQGIMADYMKIDLNPGWRITRRTYNGKPLGHVYLTHDHTLSTIAARPPQPTSPKPAITIPVPLPERTSTQKPQPVEQPAHREINQIYQEVLGREADPEGLATYTTRLNQQGWTLAQIRQDVEKSPEAQQRMIQQIYREILQREATPEDVNAYLRRVRRGTSFAKIRQEIESSPEAQALRQS